MYERKTKNEHELSEARRRAAFARKNCRGGRPKGWRKEPDALPPRTVAVNPLDLQVFQNYAGVKSMSIKGVFHLLAACLVYGSNVPARKELMPHGWVFKR